MGLSAVTIEQFPGLDLRADPGDARAAIDLANVVIEPGRVRTRDGFEVLYNTGTVPYFARAFRRPIPHLIVGMSDGFTTSLLAINSAGALVSNLTGLAATGAEGLSGQAIGTATGSFFYVCSVNVPAFAVRRWDGAAWSAPAGMPSSIQALGLSPMDNRLVTCTNSSDGCRVRFSDPGLPEVFQANNYVLLTPGDGEEIQGTAVFSNQLFVFKQSKFFVFYGTSIDGSGGPVFNYRVVDTGVGMRAPVPQSVCAGPDGVYFIANDGIYRTTGGPPTKISQALDPYFAGVAGPYWGAQVWSPTSRIQRLSYVDGRLYASLGGDLFVYDFAMAAWMYWPSAFGLCYIVASFVKSSASATLRGVAGVATDVEAPVLGYNTGVYRMLPALTLDDAGAIASYYRMSFETYGSPQQKRLRETIVEGVGAPTLQWSRDWGAPSGGSALALGTYPAVGVARQRSAIRGRAFSLRLSAAAGRWSVNRMQVNVSDSRRKPAVTT